MTTATETTKGLHHKGHEAHKEPSDAGVRSTPTRAVVKLRLQATRDSMMACGRSFTTARARLRRASDGFDREHGVASGLRPLASLCPLCPSWLTNSVASASSVAGESL